MMILHFIAEKIAKSTQASASLLALSSIPAQNTSESKGTLRPPHLSLPINFSNVWFSYPSRPTQPVLRNFNLRVEPGEVVAIVGASGCGKSTVVGLVQRLWEPTEGDIWIGDEGIAKEGRDQAALGEIDVKWLRDKLAVVSQAPTLFDTSVAENIRYGSLASLPPSSTTSSPSTNVITDTDIHTAARQANMHQVIMALGAGYDTVLGANGGGLSGGQAQRVQIARALARMVNEEEREQGRGADVLILDEGTSALDGENEGVVLDAVRSLVSSPSRSSRRKPTVLMVTHKLEVMRLCDRIVVLGSGRDAGRVVEQGKFEELLERKGEFARLASGGAWEC
jgi:ATP-binding cassette subfamily B (MDR/TAP) protein 1